MARRLTTLIALLPAMIVALVLAGCGGDKDEEQAAEQTSHDYASDLAQRLPGPGGVGLGDTMPSEPPREEIVTAGQAVDSLARNEMGHQQVSTEPAERVHTATGMEHEPAQVEPSRHVLPSEAPRREPAADSTGRPHQVAGEWAVQVGSFRQSANADEIVAQLRDAGVTAEVVPAMVSGERYYRVMVVSLATRSDAERMQSWLAANLDLQGFVRRD
jgi:cell division septation protein DedD